MNQQPFWSFVETMNRQNADASAAERGRRRPHRFDDPEYTSGNTWSYPSNFFPNMPPMPYRGRPGPPPSFPASSQAPHMSMPAFDTMPPPVGPSMAAPMPPPMPPMNFKRIPTPPPPSFGRHRSVSPSESHASTPSTPSEKPSEDSEDRDRSASPSPNRGADRDRHHACRHHNHNQGAREGGRHGKGGPPNRGRGGHGHGHGPGFGLGGPGRRHRGPPPPAFPPRDMNQFVNYINQLPGQVPEFLTNLFKSQSQWQPEVRGPNPGTDFELEPFPEVDVFNAPDAFIIHMLVPGAKKSDLDVSFEAVGNMVRVSGVIKRPDEVDEDLMKYLVQRGRSVGYFERIVCLDADSKVDADDLTAKLENGILRIEIPKSHGEEWTKVKKVQIE